MNFAIFLFVLICGIADVQAQTTPRTDQQVLDAISKRMGIEIKTPEYFRLAPPETAWTAFNYLTGNAQYGNLELVKQAGKAIAENPAVEEYVTNRISALPQSSSTDGDRASLIVPLGDVPAPWSLRLLGSYLQDETPLLDPPPVNSDYSVFTNSQRALFALFRMGFSDGPTVGRDPDVTPAVEEGWRKWWKANEGRVEQRIAEINPGYYQPTPFPVPPTPTATPIVIGEYATNTAPKPTPTPKVSPTPAAAPVSSNVDFIIYIIGGLVVLAALGALFWAAKKRD